MADDHGVLVVDDDSAIRAVLTDLLLLEGYVVRTARNGREALDVLSVWRPCVIVLDLMMPVMDGWAFRDAQRALPDARREIPVVIISAAREARVHAATLAATVIPKPFDLDQVVRAIGRVIDEPRPGGGNDPD